MKTRNTLLLVLLFAFLLCACSAETATTEGDKQADNTAVTTAKAAETDAPQTEATEAAPAKTVTLADLEGLDGKAALALLEEGGLKLSEYYAAAKDEAAEAVAQIVSDLKNGHTDPSMLYSKKELIGLFNTVKDLLKVPDRLQLYDIQNLAAEKGEKLSWADLEAWQYEDIGSGLYIRQYPVGTEQEYVLIVRGADLAAAPDEIALYRLQDGALDLENDPHIDVRTEDVAAFVNAA